eukprot:gnl/TRDRNA2_/TRDRNA2_128381_c0_seq1.p1 gnl/TRDRNA2_/TRDRNA2_128381_c0~~gnl/TRDRNA2_/TRDRNA2_128381_c0_seq1.p1  ORF type:complete len:361 (-),score=62.58 gnl/TRDRNA2_/TRDRNA2_128381_c0_seq1:114-1157(-)
MGEEDDEDLLAALEASLAEAEPEQAPPCCRAAASASPSAERKLRHPPSKPAKRRATAVAAVAWDRPVPANGGSSVLEYWPLEVRICIASFLPWRELASRASLCTAWRCLESEDSVWHVHFRALWPRLERRQEAHAEGPIPWRVLFRLRYQEDWLDFDAAAFLGGAAMSLSSTAADTMPAEPSVQSFQKAADQVRDQLLRERGVRVPAEPDSTHFCNPETCRFHRLPREVGAKFKSEAFLCEASGALHICRPGIACDISVKTENGCFLVCPVSGRCVGQTNHISDEPPPELAQLMGEDNWDPERSSTQQILQWFQQGYDMTEEQAERAFGDAHEPQACASTSSFRCCM